MKRYNLAMFDFDGTVCDTGEGIVEAVAYALKKSGIEETDESRLRLFIGPPLAASFSKHYGMSAEEAQQAVSYYRELYVVEGLYKSKLYGGIADTLSRLSAAGICCAVASGKPVEMVHELLGRFGIAELFQHVSGYEDGREQKAEIIQHLFDTNDFDKSRSVMIGDRDNDALGASLAGVDFIACSYGYAAEGEFDPFPSVFTAKTPAEIANFLLG